MTTLWFETDTGDGFREPGPTAVFLSAVTVSMVGLGWAARTIPIGTAYAVWTGVGAALTVAYAMATGAEPISALKVVFLLGIIGAVIGLKVVSDGGGQGGAAGGAAAGSARGD